VVDFNVKAGVKADGSGVELANVNLKESIWLHWLLRNTTTPP
jgi:hypothetical protein